MTSAERAAEFLNCACGHDEDLGTGAGECARCLTTAFEEVRREARDEFSREFLAEQGIDPDAGLHRLNAEMDAVDAATVAEVTAALREADRAFEKVGGSTRHHVRDCLFPALEKHGLLVVRALQEKGGQRE